MNYDLQQAKKLVDALDKRRFNRAIEGSTEAFKHVLSLITLFLQVNHPKLDGFVKNAPTGIVDFQLSDYQIHFLENEFPSEFLTLKSAANTQRTSSPILGVYVMGSFGSISQTSVSDLDTWICIPENLSCAERDLLQQKANKIQQWASQYQVEVNFYLMDQQRFRCHQYADPLTKENCGSSQYMLLLEEFYRSAVRLAGKPLLWLHLAVKEERHYEQEVERLIQQGEIDPNDWIDFGGLGQFSANEYFGASLWHLYKGIDSPYKSVLKILLLEAYSKDYPNARLIAREFKDDLFAENLTPYHHFDPYMAMLEKVTQYLTALGEFKRLDFVRRAFYVKATEDMALHHFSNWRLDYLKMWAQDWGWSADKIKELNNRPFWRIKRVKQSHNDVIKFLMLSYRNLVNFARKHRLNDNVMPQDMNILTRKLYTAFEEVPGKVTLLNAQISRNLAEKHLTFIEVRNHSHLKSGWYMVNQQPHQIFDSTQRYTEFSETLNKLVSSAYFNRLLTVETELHIISPNVSIDILRNFVADLRLSFPLAVTKSTEQELSNPCEIRHLIIIVNLTRDPTKNLENAKTALVSRDLFSFGPTQQSLVGSIDFTYRNAWNEIRTLHFEGQIAILLALKVLSNKIYRGATSPKSVQVFCYSEHYRNSLRNLVNALVKRCISIQMGNAEPTQNQLLRVAGKNWQFFFEERGISLQEIYLEEQSAVEFEAVLEKCHEEKIDNKDTTQAYPSEINAFASEGFLQFFFADNPDGTFDVYILDEANHMEIYHSCDGKKEEKVYEINQIYQRSGLEGNQNPYKIVQRDFNYPQFYQLITNESGTKIVPFHRNL